MLPAVSSSSRLTRGARIRLRTLVLSSALVAAGIQPVAAQTVDDDDASMAAQQLNLPKDVTVFGQSDPNVRKATAIVNGRIITGTDVDQRLALLQARCQLLALALEIGLHFAQPRAALIECRQVVVQLPVQRTELFESLLARRRQRIEIVLQPIDLGRIVLVEQEFQLGCGAEAIERIELACQRLALLFAIGGERLTLLLKLVDFAIELTALGLQGIDRVE